MELVLCIECILGINKVELVVCIECILGINKVELVLKIHAFRLLFIVNVYLLCGIFTQKEGVHGVHH